MKEERKLASGGETDATQNFVNDKKVLQETGDSPIIDG